MQNSNYNHNTIENKIYHYWVKNNFFKPKKGKKKYFSIVIPPPNVTGSLHMGHALNKLILMNIGHVAEWLRRGLQILLFQFDSGRGLQTHLFLVKLVNFSPNFI